MATLTSFLQHVPDHRRAQGKRVPFLGFLEMVILAGLSGHFGLRPVARFIKNNESFFIDRYNLFHGVPTYGSVQNFIKGLDFEALNEALSNWTKQFVDSDKWIAIDGKAISSTVTDMHGQRQNFKSIVTLFCTEKDIVIASKSFENKIGNETQTARALIDQLNMEGVTFTMDALHCKKKPPRVSWPQEMTMYSK